MSENNQNQAIPTIFKTPFTPKYWHCAFSELKSVKMLVIAAILIAMRVALKALVIPVGESLNIGIGFFVNALGAMIFGPVIALIGAAISDTLGCLIFPSGPYFFPFIFVELAGSFIFALFLYRAKLTPVRVILSRFTVSLVCNILLNPFILSFYYQYVLGKSYKLLSLPRVIKNLVLFPAESLLLVIFIGALLPVLKRMKLIPGEQTDGLKLNRKHIILLVVLFIISAVIIYLYYNFYLKS